MDVLESIGVLNENVRELSEREMEDMMKRQQGKTGCMSKNTVQG